MDTFQDSVSISTVGGKLSGQTARSLGRPELPVYAAGQGWGSSVLLVAQLVCGLGHQAGSVGQLHREQRRALSCRSRGSAVWAPRVHTRPGAPRI